MNILEAKKEDGDIIFKLFSELMDVHVHFAPTLFKPAVKDEIFNKFVSEAIDNDNQKIFIEYLDDLPIGYIYIFIDQLNKTTNFRIQVNPNGKFCCRTASSLGKSSQAGDHYYFLL